MSFQRNDVEASAEEKYAADLQARVALVSKKSWKDMSPEDKDTVAEFVAWRAGFVKAP